MATLGELLRKEREEAGVSAEKAAELLKVRRDYIQNVEEDNYQELPPDVYIRGFLKNYARLLNLDEEKVLEVYRHQQGISKRTGTHEGDLRRESMRKIPRFVLTPELIFGGASILVVVLIVLYFLRVSGTFSKPPTLIVTSPTENATVDQEHIQIEGRVDEGASLKINGQEVNIREEGGFSMGVTLMEGLNEIKLLTENKFGKVTEKILTVSYKGPNGGEAVTRARKVVTLTADSEPVWFTVYVGEDSFSETLPAYGERTLDIEQETRVVVGKGNGVYLKINGGNLEIFAEEDGEAERVFTP